MQVYIIESPQKLAGIYTAKSAKAALIQMLDAYSIRLAKGSEWCDKPTHKELKAEWERRHGKMQIIQLP